MKLYINLEISEAAEFDDARVAAILAALAGAGAVPATPSVTVTSSPQAAPAPAAPTAADPAPSAPVTPPADPVQLPKVDALVAEAQAKYQAAATGTGAGGVQLRVDDEVVDEFGQVAVIHFLYRGGAVIGYDDNTGAIVKTATLSPYVNEQQPYEEEPEEAEVVEEPNPLADPAPEITLQAIYELANAVMAAKGGAVVQKAFLQHGGSGVIKGIPQERYAAVYAALQELQAG